MTHPAIHRDTCIDDACHDLRELTTLADSLGQRMTTARIHGGNPDLGDDVRRLVRLASSVDTMWHMSRAFATVLREHEVSS